MKTIEAIIKDDGTIGSYTLSGGGHLVRSKQIDVPDDVTNLSGYKYIDGQLVKPEEEET